MSLRSRFVNFTQYRLLVALASTLVSSLAALPAHSSSVFTESVRFTSSPRGHVLIPVSIDGGEPLVFVLDTGAGKTVVTPKLVEKLGLEEERAEREVTRGVHGETENAVVNIQSLAVGGLHIADIQAVVLELDHITRGYWHVDGILGMDFLTRFDVRLDFKASMVSFYSAASDRSMCAACPPGIDGIEFETIDPGFIVLPATVDATPVNAVLDSGSGHSGLNLKAATTLGVELPPMSAGAQADHAFGIQTGPVRVGDTTLSERTALHVMEHPVMEALGLANRPTMLMGTDQLKDRTVTICYGLATLFLQ